MVLIDDIDLNYFDLLENIKPKISICVIIMQRKVVVNFVSLNVAVEKVLKDSVNLRVVVIKMDVRDSVQI